MNAAPDVSPGRGTPDARASDGEALAEQYARMAHAYEGRRVDAALRALDVLISGATLLLLSPALALVALAIRVVSGRPVLYRGERVGRAGEIFRPAPSYP